MKRKTIVKTLFVISLATFVVSIDSDWSVIKAISGIATGWLLVDILEY